MPDDRVVLLNRILDAMFVAEFCDPPDRPKYERERDELLAEASRLSGKGALLIKQALLKQRYPEYRAKRLAIEMPSVAKPVRRN